MKDRKKIITMPIGHKEKCEFSSYCPARGKCVVNDIYTRYKKYNCPCRDLIK